MPGVTLQVAHHLVGRDMIKDDLLSRDLLQFDYILLLLSSCFLLDFLGYLHILVFYIIIYYALCGILIQISELESHFSICLDSRGWAAATGIHCI